VLAVALASAVVSGKPDPRQFLHVDTRHHVAALTLVALGSERAANVLRALPEDVAMQLVFFQVLQKSSTGAMHDALGNSRGTR